MEQAGREYHWKKQKVTYRAGLKAQGIKILKLQGRNVRSSRYFCRSLSWHETRMIKIFRGVSSHTLENEQF